MSVAPGLLPNGQLLPLPGSVDPQSTGVPAAAPTAPAGTAQPASNTYGAVQVNKYAPVGAASSPADASWEEAQQVARDAGLPYTPTAQAQRLANQIGSPPELGALRDAMKSIQVPPGPQSTADVGRIARAARNLFDATQSRGDIANVNVWALVLIALQGVVQDQNEQLSYNYSKLDQYSQIGKAYAKYGDELASKQQELNDKVAKESDTNKKQNMTVGVEHQYASAPDFESLNPDGSIRAKNTVKAPEIDPKDIQDKGKSPPHPGEQTQYYKYKAPDGNWYESGRGTDAERRVDVIEQSKANAVKPDGTATQLNMQSLSNLVQLYQQNRELLQKNVDKWQNRFQTDSQTKNEYMSALTQVLKNMHDESMGAARNLL